MAYFAQIDEDGTVQQVIAIDNGDAPNPTPEVSEPEGQRFIAEALGLPGLWLQTSYTSRHGNRINPNTGEIVTPGDHFRFNYASIGGIFDPDLGPDGAFIPPRPSPDWTFDPESASWLPPVEP